MFAFLFLVIGAIALALAFRAVLALLMGLAFMHAVGVIHHEWIPQLPTLGYWWSVLISLLISLALVPPISPDNSSS
jgi:cytosine/uracil/thiamine/allantoin permease